MLEPERRVLDSGSILRRAVRCPALFLLRRVPCVRCSKPIRSAALTGIQPERSTLTSDPSRAHPTYTLHTIITIITYQINQCSKETETNTESRLLALQGACAAGGAFDGADGLPPPAAATEGGASFP